MSEKTAFWWWDRTMSARPVLLLIRCKGRRTVTDTFRQRIWVVGILKGFVWMFDWNVLGTRDTFVVFMFLRKRISYEHGEDDETKRCSWIQPWICYFMNFEQYRYEIWIVLIREKNTYSCLLMFSLFSSHCRWRYFKLFRIESTLAPLSIMVSK